MSSWPSSSTLQKGKSLATVSWISSASMDYVSDQSESPTRRLHRMPRSRSSSTLDTIGAASVSRDVRPHRMRELKHPPEIAGDKKATEMIRVWLAHDQLHVSMLLGMWQDAEECD